MMFPQAIDSFIPHAGAMCLLNQVVSANHETLVAQVTITPDSPFAAEQGVPGWIGLEYMAQAIAAFAGVQEHGQGQRPGIGFLVSARRYRCDQPYFDFGSTLLVAVTIELEGDNGLRIFRCAISAADQQLVSATLSVFRPRPDDDMSDIASLNGNKESS